MFCPCWFGAKDLMVMDRGWCDSAIAFRIFNGKSDGVDLSGCTVVVAMDFPGPTLFDGNGTVRLYVDKTASGEQHAALESIFQGRSGGPMQVIASLTSRWLPTQSANIDVKENGDSIVVTVGNLGSLQSQLLKNDAGETVTMQNAGFAAMFGFEDVRAELAPSSSRWSDVHMPRSFETKSGARGVCNWSA
jgi:hypothetical protein